MKKILQATVGLIIFASLSACVTTLSKGPNGGCAKEDFVTQVSGGGECLAIKTEFPQNIPRTNEYPVLLITVHGDSNPSSWERAKSIIPELDSTNAILIHIKRLGYAGSTGTALNYGFNQPVDQNNLPVMEAIHNLKIHYNAKQVRAMGHSGGSNILATGSALYPDYAPDRLLLSSCGCNLAKVITANQWNVLPGGISAHEVAHKTPKNIQVIAVTGSDDRRTPPSVAQEYISILKNNNIQAHFELIDGGTHRNVRMTEKFKFIAKNFLLGN